MKISHVLVLAAATAMIAAPALAAKKKPAAPPCVKGKLLTAYQMRMLQTELVVGALSCKLTPRYNEFVNAYQKELMTAHRALKAHYASESRLEDYKSKTANESSQRSLANITEFCLYTSSLYDKLLGPERVQLDAFVALEPVANRHNQNACSTPALVTASASGKVVPMPRVKPEMEAAAAPVSPQAKPEAAAEVIPAAAAPAQP
ncbi:MAG: hypothetical protein K8S25_05515 [Alphaproteobacteria bacterium]|nr:hypothetical protein [Alphaproteobacteria bacterium]